MIFCIDFNVIRSLFLSLVLLAFPVLAHKGHSHKAPWEACLGTQKDQACEYKNANKDLFKGTCQVFSERLMCVRNSPIIKAETIMNKTSLLELNPKGINSNSYNNSR